MDDYNSTGWPLVWCCEGSPLAQLSSLALLVSMLICFLILLILSLIYRMKLFYTFLKGELIQPCVAFRVHHKVKKMLSLQQFCFCFTYKVVEDWKHMLWQKVHLISGLMLILSISSMSLICNRCQFNYSPRNAKGVLSWCLSNKLQGTRTYLECQTS